MVEMSKHIGKITVPLQEHVDRFYRQELANDLERYNQWRRGADDIEQPNPTELGILIDEIVKELRK